MDEPSEDHRLVGSALRRRVLALCLIEGWAYEEVTQLKLMSYVEKKVKGEEEQNLSDDELREYFVRFRDTNLINLRWNNYHGIIQKQHQLWIIENHLTALHERRPTWEEVNEEYNRRKSLGEDESGSPSLRELHGEEDNKTTGETEVMQQESRKPEEPDQPAVMNLVVSPFRDDQQDQLEDLVQNSKDSSLQVPAMEESSLESPIDLLERPLVASEENSLHNSVDLVEELLQNQAATEECESTEPQNGQDTREQKDFKGTLYEMLISDDTGDSVAFFPEIGTIFFHGDPVELESIVLRRYFKDPSFDHLSRWLRNCGFTQTKSEDCVVFRHTSVKKAEDILKIDFIGCTDDEARPNNEIQAHDCLSRVRSLVNDGQTKAAFLAGFYEMMKANHPEIRLAEWTGVPSIFIDLGQTELESDILPLYFTTAPQVNNFKQGLKGCGFIVTKLRERRMVIEHPMVHGIDDLLRLGNLVQTEDGSYAISSGSSGESTEEENKNRRTGSVSANDRPSAHRSVDPATNMDHERSQNCDESVISKKSEKIGFLERLHTMLSANHEGIDFVEGIGSKGAQITSRIEPKKFESDLLPDYFSVPRMSNFQRTLKNYGFSRTNPEQGSAYFIFEHPSLGTLDDILHLKYSPARARRLNNNRSSVAGESTTEGASSTDSCNLGKKGATTQQMEMILEKVLFLLRADTNAISFQPGVNGNHGRIVIHDRQRLSRHLPTKYAISNIDVLTSHLSKLGFHRVKDSTVHAFENAAVKCFDHMYLLEHNERRGEDSEPVSNERKRKGRKPTSRLGKRMKGEAADEKTPGTTVYAAWENEQYYWGVITKKYKGRGNGDLFQVLFNDGDVADDLKPAQITTKAEYRHMAIEMDITPEIEPFPRKYIKKRDRLMQEGVDSFATAEGKAKVKDEARHEGPLHIELDDLMDKERVVDQGVCTRRSEDSDEGAEKAMSLESLFQNRCGYCRLCARNECQKCANCRFNKRNPKSAKKVCYRKVSTFFNHET